MHPGTYVIQTHSGGQLEARDGRGRHRAHKVRTGLVDSRSALQMQSAWRTAALISARRSSSSSSSTLDERATRLAQGYPRHKSPRREVRRVLRVRLTTVMRAMARNCRMHELVWRPAPKATKCAITGECRSTAARTDPREGCGDSQLP